MFAGSSSVYGDTEVLPKTETMPTRPLSPYALQKLTSVYKGRASALEIDGDKLTAYYEDGKVTLP